MDIVLDVHSLTIQPFLIINAWVSIPTKQIVLTLCVRANVEDSMYLQVVEVTGASVLTCPRWDRMPAFFSRSVIPAFCSPFKVSLQWLYIWPRTSQRFTASEGPMTKVTENGLEDSYLCWKFYLSKMPRSAIPSIFGVCSWTDPVLKDHMLKCLSPQTLIEAAVQRQVLSPSERKYSGI